MDEMIDYIRYSDTEGMNALRTLLGVLSIILIIICCVCCLYKYAVCQERRRVRVRDDFHIVATV